MPRKLFCDLSPAAYKISEVKEQYKRYIKDLTGNPKFATGKALSQLPVLVYSHHSLIKRKLGNVDMRLQENKAKNLAIAAPLVNGVMIKSGETFSFWKLVGDCTSKKGYRTGLKITNGRTSEGIGGGMCQFTNLIHWLILHSSLDIMEYHHHDGVDLFPDNNRQVPFGCGTSIKYNYLDYRFKNNTGRTYQLVVNTTEEYLSGELRADSEEEYLYSIIEEDACFLKEGDLYYRHNKIYKQTFDKKTGDLTGKSLIKENHARVMYDEFYIDKDKLIEGMKGVL